MIGSCVPRGSAAVTRETVVGEYVYYADDPGVPHSPDRLVLRGEGSYTLVSMTDGQAVATEEGKWELWTDGGESRITFRGRGYPVSLREGHVRLMINSDRGHWYEKVNPDRR